MLILCRDYSVSTFDTTTQAVHDVHDDSGQRADNEAIIDLFSAVYTIFGKPALYDEIRLFAPSRISRTPSLTSRVISAALMALLTSPTPAPA